MSLAQRILSRINDRRKDRGKEPIRSSQVRDLITELASVGETVDNLVSELDTLHQQVEDLRRELRELKG